MTAKEQRMILAGRYMLGDGLSFKQALIQAGYSEQTARCPKANGLSAKRCAELALKDGRQVLPATLRVSARELFQKKLDAGLADPETVSLTAAARAVETVERVYSHSDENQEPGPRSFVDRLQWLHTVAQELRSRGIDPTVEQVVTSDAVVIDVGVFDDSGASGS